MTTQTPTRPEAGGRNRVVLIIWLVVAALIVSAAFVSTARGGSGDEARSRLALIAPAAPGGGWDLVAREAQQALKADGVVNNVQVVNIPGAAGTIGLGQVADMAGQGGTMMVTGTVMVGGVIANHSHTTLADVTPIARLAEDFEVIVVPKSSPYTTLDQFVEAWRANAHGMSIGGGSKGGTDHLLAGMIAEEVGIDPSTVNYIAFSGGGEALNALLSNTVAAGISGYNDFADQIEAGNVRVLAIGTRERVDGFDIPSLGEQGIDVELTNWRGLVAPPGLTEEQRNVLIEIVGEMHEGASWTDTLERNRWRDTFITGDEFGAFIDDEMTRIGDIAQRLGIGG